MPKLKVNGKDEWTIHPTLRVTEYSPGETTPDTPHLRLESRSDAKYYAGMGIVYMNQQGWLRTPVNGVKVTYTSWIIEQETHNEWGEISL